MRYSKYPAYKDSGVEWLGEIPTKWHILRGKFLFSNKKELNTFMQCDTRLSLTLNGVIERSKTAAEGLQPEKFDTYQVFNKGNLVFKLIDLENKQTSRVGYVHKRGIMSPAYIRLERSSDINIRFAYYLYYRLYIEYIYNSLGGNGVRSALNAADLLEVPLQVGSPQEQKTIANYLDKATAKIDTLIAKQTRLIELLKEKRQAVISTAVTRGLDSTVPMKDSGVAWLGEIPEGWEVWKMTHAFNTIGSGTTPSSTNELYYNGYIPWVTTGELRENIITGTKKLLTDEAIRDNSSLKLFPINSIIIAMYGATIGRLGVLGIKATTNQACCVMTDSSSIKNEYLYYWLMGYRDEIVKLGYGGGQPNISQDTISNLQVSAPSLGEQEQIVHHLDSATSKIDTLITKATKAIDLLKEKRTALISATVTGKIDVRDVS